MLDGRLRQGERVRILALDDPKPLEVTFQPILYQELQDTAHHRASVINCTLGLARVLLPWDEVSFVGPTL